jgi:hypothetical protein
MGYGLYRLIKSLGHECIVVAPSLIPKKPGDRVKTNRRDAVSLAKLLRADELTAVWVPDERHEAMRDLSRARQATKKDLQGKRQQISSLMLRQGRSYPGKKTWGPAHKNWLMAQKLEHREQRMAVEELLEGMRQEEERVERLEQAIRAAVPSGRLPRWSRPCRRCAASISLLRELHGRQGQPWRHHQGWERSSSTHPGRSRLGLSASCTCRPGEAAEGGGRTEACEGTSPRYPMSSRGF